MTSTGRRSSRTRSTTSAATEGLRLYPVHGERGEDPTEPLASDAFPHPAVSHEPRIQQLHDDLLAAGYRPFHLPVGIDLDETDPEAGRCMRCDRFDGFPCLTDGKAVVVACGAANSAALLLRSASDRHPGGLANSSTRSAATTGRTSTPA